MSEKPQTRKKQPEYVRQQLLQSAARLATGKGAASVTVSAVAQAAGVTKGGFFHHFPSKQALIEGLFADVIQRMDQDLDRFIAEDPQAFGCFTRAYVKSAFLDNQSESCRAVLNLSLNSDNGLIQRWDQWLTNRLQQHRDTDDHPQLEVVRLAADGMWFTSWLKHSSAAEKFQHLEQQLMALTYHVG